MSLDFPSLSTDNNKIIPMDPKKKSSDPGLSSDLLKKQIRSYMSSESIFDFKSKVQASSDKSSWETTSNTTITTPSRKISTQSDSALGLKHFKPFIPKSHRYSSSNIQSFLHEPPTQTALPLLPQGYTSVYVPVMSMSYYPVGTLSELLTGELKFFDETQNYGFFMLDTTGEDLFVHYDDFVKSGISKECIRTAKNLNLKFAFRCISYYGKYNLSYKAVDIHLLTELGEIKKGAVQ